MTEKLKRCRPKKASKKVSSTFWVGDYFDPLAKVELDHRQRWIVMTENGNLKGKPIMIVHPTAGFYLFLSKEVFEQRFEMVEEKE